MAGPGEARPARADVETPREPGSSGDGETAVRSVQLDEGSRTLTLQFSDGSRVEVAPDAPEARGLAPGSVVDGPRFAALRAAAGRKAVARALYGLLDRRARCRADLRRRLLQSGHEAPLVDQVLDDATEQGLVDDRAYARAWAHDQLLRKAVGRRWLLAKLRTQGISERDARAGVGEVLEPRDELALAVRALSGRRLDLEDERQRAKGLRFLLGRGFDQATSLAALRELRRATTEDESANL